MHSISNYKTFWFKYQVFIATTSISQPASAPQESGVAEAETGTLQGGGQMNIEKYWQICVANEE